MIALFSRRRNADVIHLDDHRLRVNAALAPVVQLPLRRPGVSAVEYLFGLAAPSTRGEGRPATAGTSWSKVDRPTPTACLSTAVGEIEPSTPALRAHAASKCRAPRGLSLVSLTTGGDTRDRLTFAETAPLRTEQRRP